MDTTKTEQKPFQPVVLGADIGTYAMARSFYEMWGVRPVVIATMLLGPIRDSQILDARLVAPDQLSEQGSRAPLVQALIEWGPQIQQEFAGKKLLLVANTDTNVRDIMANADRLRQYYTFAFPSNEILEMTNDKERFPQVAAEYGMNVPQTVPVELSDEIPDIKRTLEPLQGAFPWIIKSSVAYGFERLKWPGKKKVYSAANWDEAEAVFTHLRQIWAAHPDIHRFVVQPKIEGNDTYNLSITTYTDSAGRVTMLGSAHVLLEDHNPTALGNPAAMITEQYPGLYEPVRAFQEGVGWHGYSNYDVKIDRRNGEVYFLEVNPRIGRNCYYNTAAGLNAMKYVVEDMVNERRINPEVVQRSVLYTVLPKRLLLRYVDPAMRAKVTALYRAGRVFNPLRCAGERRWSLEYLRRSLYLRATKLNHFRKYHRNYPRATFRAGGVESYDTVTLTRPQN